MFALCLRLALVNKLLVYVAAIDLGLCFSLSSCRGRRRQRRQGRERFERDVVTVIVSRTS